MSDEPSVPVDEAAEPNAPNAVDFSLYVRPDTSCTIEFFDREGGPSIAAIALSADLADALAVLLSPKQRRAAFEQARDAFRKSRH